MRLRHPSLDMPIIDYDLAVLLQPMLMLGISIGVAFNVIFADWMVTVLLIILFVGTSSKALFKGIETWNKETIMKKEAAKLQLESESKPESKGEYKPLPTGPLANYADDIVPMIRNVYWKELGLLMFVWVAFLAIQIVKLLADLHCDMLNRVLDFKLIAVAGIVGGLFGLGGGFILGPLFLELGISPQFTFQNAASYFVSVATIAALVGQQ
ncbi:hypothetical protein RND71_011828 [Anisodus tanguticus]|uniref:Uncharacterized protein n=1 Tax=Anisodus tanguticus TaxID=243964 RepID=A0AAE1VL85_9SOLA|nr:hypothetical protein RND71_011828 [Anisodus tanguticus]